MSEEVVITEETMQSGIDNAEHFVKHYLEKQDSSVVVKRIDIPKNKGAGISELSWTTNSMQIVIHSAILRVTFLVWVLLHFGSILELNSL